MPKEVTSVVRISARDKALYLGNRCIAGGQ